MVVNGSEEKVRVHTECCEVCQYAQSNGRSNPEVVGLILTEVNRYFSFPRVVP